MRRWNVEPLVLLLAGFVVWIGAACDEDGDGPGVAPDMAPPEVISMVPGDGAVGVAEEGVVEIIFSEPVVLDSLVVPLILLDDTGAEIAALVTLDATGTRLTLVPAAPLVVGFDYEAVLAAGIADRNGNARPEALTVRFSTALAFLDIGRIFTANEFDATLSVLDLLTYEPVPGSPLPLDVNPTHLHGVPERGLLYVLYRTSLADAGGVLAIDARSLAVLGDSGPVLRPGLSDLVVSPEDDLLFVASPRENGILVLDATTLASRRPPHVFDRVESEPVVLAVSERFGWLLVGLDGGARLDVLELPGLTPVAGFPVATVDRMHSIEIEEARGRAWVGGALRYAIVDLVNPTRTIAFQVPTMPCRFCTQRLWKLHLVPELDRVFLMNRRQSLASLLLSSLDQSPETPGGLNRNLFLNDIAINPRTRELVVLGLRNLETPLWLFDPMTLDLTRELDDIGDGSVALEILP